MPVNRPVSLRRWISAPAVVALTLAGFGGLAPSAAQDFGSIGARSIAMGGTGVALADDAVAVHFNPAGLAIRPHPDTVVGGGGTASDRNDFARAVERLGQADRVALAAGDPVVTAAVLADLERLAASGSGLDGGLHAAVFLTQNGGGLSAEGQGWASIRPEVDLVHASPGANPATGIANNTTTIHFRGLETREGVLTYAVSILPALLSIGANARYVRGTTYESNPVVFDLDRSSRDQLVRDALDKNSESTNRFAWDLGVLITPISNLRIGATARYINSPKFRTYDGGEIRIDRQIRAGVAFTPTDFREVALTADVDVTSHSTDLGGEARRFVGVGGEYQMGLVSLRAGARGNLTGSDRRVVPTAGFGVGTGAFRAEVGAAWRKDKDADVSVSLRWSLPE